MMRTGMYFSAAPWRLNARIASSIRDRGENGPDIAVTALGIEDLVVVVSDNALLVMPKDRAQDVKKIVEELKHRGTKHL